jgi:hypothetical protein
MSKQKSDTNWLLLLYQFPKGSGSRRVKVWRRLQSIGAVAIKGSVYVLPGNDQSQEDFSWLLQELKKEGADGAILESHFIDGMDDQQVRDLFNSARSADYEALRNEVADVVTSLSSSSNSDAAELQLRARKTLIRAKKQFSEIEAIDFFNAIGHDGVESDILELDNRINNSRVIRHTEEEIALAALENRVWVTRRGVKVDRIASAWLIRRFIDPKAKFKFVSANGYAPIEDELRFDMFEAEFTHEGDMCTFEVLIRLAGQEDRALQCIGEIIHDIDLKDDKFGRPETKGIANLLTGSIAGVEDDDRRIEKGSRIFEDLYRFFSDVRA